MTENTLDHFRENFYSFIVDRSAWKDVDLLSHEKQIIDEANERYAALLASYTPPTFDTDRLHALDAVIEQAKKVLL